MTYREKRNKPVVMPTPMPTPCREWLGPSSFGYGIRNIRQPDGRYRAVRIHRWVWEQVHGPIPKGMVVMHLCDNPPCYRYDHLRLATQAENNRDRAVKGRSADSRGELCPSAKLTWEIVDHMRRLWAAGHTQTDIARHHNVHIATAHSVVRHKSWKSRPEATRETRT